MSQISDFTEPALFDALTDLLSRAGAEIMRIRASSLPARMKADATPVTPADEASEAIILEGLARLLPGLDVVSEESPSRPRPQPGRPFALIDPLDGTKEILAGRDEFSVNVAIVDQGRPVTGVIYAPARGQMWRGAEGRGSQRLEMNPGTMVAQTPARRIATRKAQPGALVALVSRSHPDEKTQAFIDRFAGIRQQPCGSSLKLGLLAEGSADLYPRLAPVSEWDIAAGQAILTAAGGAVVSLRGEPLAYGRHDCGYAVQGFVAYGDPSLQSAGVET